MPHQCVRCNIFYDDGSDIIIKGCKCGGKLFFFVRKEKLEEAKRLASQINLSDKDKEKIEEDVFELIGHEKPDEPVVLDLEAIHVTKPGKYEIDLVHLFRGDPLIFKIEEGKYMIDVANTFEQYRKKRK